MPFLTTRRIKDRIFPDPGRLPTAGVRDLPQKIVLAPRPGLEPSTKPPVRIYLGTEPGQYRAERVFVWSVEKVRDPSRTYEIHLMKDVRGYDRRWWLTGFTNYRFAIANWAGYWLLETFSDEWKPYEGRIIGEVALELGRDPWDLLCDIVIADELRTGLRPGGMRETADDWRMRAAVWRDPRTVIGGSDAGAHLDMMCGAIYSTALLAHGVRDFEVITLEAAIRELTSVPADLYGLTDRGRIVDGGAADLVLFDLDTIGYGTERLRADLPGGASRLYAEATGVHSVLVNGEIIVDDGDFMGVTPGRLLRSGRDTHTVTP